MPKVLAIDDSENNVRLMKDILSVKNHVIETATSGDRGIEKFTTFKPDLVLLDLAMPGMDGNEVLRRLIKLDENVCVVMVSAAGNRQLLEDCIERGAIGYVEKPFSVKNLASVVDSVVAGKTHPRMFAFLSLIVSKAEKKIQDVLGSAATLRLTGMSIAGSQIVNPSFRSKFSEESSMHMQQGTVIFFSRFEGGRNGIIGSLVRDSEIDVFLGDALYEKTQGRYKVGSDFFGLINNRFLTEISRQKKLEIKRGNDEFHIVRQGDTFWKSLTLGYTHLCRASLEMFYAGSTIEFEVHVSSDSDLLQQYHLSHV